MKIFKYKWEFICHNKEVMLLKTVDKNPQVESYKSVAYRP